MMSNVSLPIYHQYEFVDGVNIFYRKAGNVDRPTLVLLHGFAASSFMFRNLIPILSEKYYVIAPDLPAFGLTEVSDKYEYSFDQIALTMEKFLQKLGVTKYSLLVHDYGAPIGWRMAIKNPNAIEAIISQNGNAYEEGLSPLWSSIKKYWENPTTENRESLRPLVTPESIKWQYLEGVNDETIVPPECYIFEGNNLLNIDSNIHLDLILDYKSNIDLYIEFQKYLTDYQPPLLAVWGKNDPFFLPEGAQMWKRDLPSSQIFLYDTGHFALETHLEPISSEIMKFLNQNI